MFCPLRYAKVVLVDANLGPAYKYASFAGFFGERRPKPRYNILQEQNKQMSVIFVNTDNSNATNKLFVGTKAGTEAKAVEDVMQKVVVKIISKQPGFTTMKTPNPKGYSIKLEIDKLQQTPNETSCSLKGELVRYPNSFTVAKKGGAATMVSTSFTGSAKATGSGKFAVIDCVEAIVESMIPKAIPAMRQDMLQR